jgi:hypothetical protein
VIVVAVVALVLLPLLVLRRRTLVAYYGIDAATWLLAYLIWLHTGLDARLGCIAVAVTKLVTFFLFLARGTDVRWSANRAAAIAAIIYALAIPVTMLHPPDGDEHYYLLITDSLVHERDLDLSNQYRKPELLTLFNKKELGPQTGDPTGPRGEQYSRHEPFLSLLLVPGYALAGLHGALATIALFGVLLVRSTIRWMEDEGVSDEAARAVFPFFAFAPPVLFYTTRVWPEVPAAFFFVEALRGVRDARMKRWLPALFGLVMLKLRFVLVAAGLIATVLVERRASARRGFRWDKAHRSTGIVIGTLILVAPLAVMYLLTGDPTNVHSWRELLPAPGDRYPGDRYVRGFFGLFADGMSGIAFQAPFYLFGLFALTRWTQTPRGFRTGMLASLLYILYLLPRPEWFGGWAPPLRYLVFLMPVLALGAAAVWDRISRGAIAIVAAWTAALVAHRLAYPWRNFHIANGENALGEWLSQHYHADFSRLFPSFIRANDARWIGVAVVFALILIGIRRFKFDLAIPLFALALAFGARAAKQPASHVEFEDAHVIRPDDPNGLSPHFYQEMRWAYRGGWVLQQGQQVEFLARAGTWRLDFNTGLGATFELAGHAYHVLPHNDYQSIRVTIPRSERVTLRCVSGAINLDRMRRE